MIALWMLYTTFVALLLGTAALAADKMARLYRLPGRWAWVLSAAGSVMVPALALLRSSDTAARLGGTVELLRDTGSAVGGVPPDWSGGSALLAMVHAAAAVVAAMLGTARAAAARLDTMLSPLDPVLLSLWALMSVGFLVYIGVSGWRVHRVLKRSRAERVDGHDVLISEGTGPAVVGLWRQHIVVPEWVLDEADGARRMILAHEREHVAAGDPRLLAFSFAILALMPWNPALWWQIRRLRLALELDCDTRVLRVSTDRHGYGTLLLNVVERGGRNTFMATFAEPITLLERRIRALSDAPPAARGRRAVLALAGTALLVAAACATPHPGAATPASVTGPETTESTRPTPFAFVVTSTSTGIAAVCSRGCRWKTLSASYRDGEYGITDIGVGAASGAEQSASPGGFSIALTGGDGKVSATCARGCLWKTVSGTSPTKRFRITQTGIDPLR